MTIFVSPRSNAAAFVEGPSLIGWLKSIFGATEPAPEPLPQLEMLRDHLDNLPDITVPEGYALRTFEPGDEQAWCDIMEGNVGENWSIEKFREKMSSDERFSPDGLYFATFEGLPVASACAWRPKIDEKIVGDVHMVGALAAHRGKGLGHLVNAAVLHKLKEQGYQKAHLKTDDWRLAAINSYLKAGFEPMNTHISHAERWDVILDKIAAFEQDRVAD